MIEAKARFSWNQTALLALVAWNSHVADPAQAKTLADFLPAQYAGPRNDDAKTIPGNDITVLKVLLPQFNPASIYGQH